MHASLSHSITIFWTVLTTLRVDTEQNIQSLGPHGADILGGEDSEQISLPYIR